MEREIKFDYILKSRVGDHYTHNYLTLDEIQQGIYIFHFVADELVARRQFTGIKDRHGVDIYEGDLLGAVFVWGGVFGKVVFEESSFAIKDLHNGSLLHFSDHNITPHYEIAGNIYENPELIEGE